MDHLNGLKVFGVYYGNLFKTEMIRQSYTCSLKVYECASSGMILSKYML